MIDEAQLNGDLEGSVSDKSSLESLKFENYMQLDEYHIKEAINMSRLMSTEDIAPGSVAKCVLPAVCRHGDRCLGSKEEALVAKGADPIDRRAEVLIAAPFATKLKSQ